jgi:hypothetical protein
LTQPAADIRTSNDNRQSLAPLSRHPDYDDERISYVRAYATDEIGTASHYVEDLYVTAVPDAGLGLDDALCEGIAEFRAALERGEIRRIR